LPKCIKPPLIQYFISRYSYVYQITSNSTIWLLFRHNFQIGKILVRCISSKDSLIFSLQANNRLVWKKRSFSPAKWIFTMATNCIGRNTNRKRITNLYQEFFIRYLLVYYEYMLFPLQTRLYGMYVKEFSFYEMRCSYPLWQDKSSLQLYIH